MNRTATAISFALALGAGLLGALLSPALADGDPYYSNGINASGVRTPVPAPIPVPVEEADWYFRGDFAAGFGSTPSINVLGTNLVEADSVRSDAWLSQLRALVHRRRRRRLRLGTALPHRSHRRRPLDHERRAVGHRLRRSTAGRQRSYGDRQDQVHVDHPARQRLLRHPHRHALDAVPRRRPRLRRQSGDAQSRRYRPPVQAPTSPSATAPPMCNLPPPPWPACPTTSPRSSPST